MPAPHPAREHARADAPAPSGEPSPAAIDQAPLAPALREPYTGAAAGPAGVYSALAYAVRTAGAARSVKSLLALNQKRGFDCPSCAWPDPEHRALAEFCENGARAVAHEADARRADQAFFKAHKAAELAAQSDHWLEQQGRLTTPLILRPGAFHFAPIGYDEAFDLIAEELRALASPDEAAFYTSGRTSNEAAFLYQLFARAFGTNNLPDCSNMCHESSGKGLEPTLGIGKGTVTLADFDKADLILIAGQNPGTNHPRMLTTLLDAAKRGATVVSINPLRERGLESFAHPQRPLGMLGVGAPIATRWVRVRIGGDVALLKGVMKELIALERERFGGVIDRAFIAEHTLGFEDFTASLAEAPWDAIEVESGVPRAQMRELAELYAASERTIACWAMGLTQHKHGVANVRELVNLLLLRGNVGREGAGPCPVRGHSNVQGDRTVGIYEAPSEAFLARLDEATGIRSPRAHGLDVVGTIAAMEAGKIKVFFAMGGNFVAATPDTDRTSRALGNARLAVHVATKLNRTHLTRAGCSIVLPCLARSEEDARAGAPRFVTVENSMGIVHPSRGSLRPASPELKSEPEIVAAVAARVVGDLPRARWSWLAEDYDRIRDLIEASIAGFERYNERVRAPGGFYLPNGPRERRWSTKSGKAHFTAQELPHLPLGEGQLVMMTIRSHDQFNTTVYALDDRYRGVYGERRVVFMHPEDMAERSLTEGQKVDITSHFRGETREVRGFVGVPYDIPRRCVATYFPEANPLVPLEHHADESKTPASKSVIVTVRASAR
jgi:molybdopterin-dependent oxidoreductase alpha subunit